MSFNIGVELGQLFVLALIVPALNFAFHRVIAERMGTIVLSAIVAHTGWHWMIERGNALRQFQFGWPVIDAAALAALMRMSMLLLVAAGTGWALFGIVRHATSERSDEGIIRP